MASNRLRLQLTGTEEGGDIRLELFVAQLERFERALRETDRGTSDDRDTNSVYSKIVDLQHNSPAVIEIELVPLESKIATKAPDTDRPVFVAQKLVEYVRAVKQGQVPADIDSETYQAITSMMMPMKRGISEILISNNGTSVSITPNFADDLPGVDDTDDYEWGSVSGMLQAVNLHGRRPRFRIYPITRATPVQCAFSPKLRSTVRLGLDHYVEAYGRLAYKAGQVHPYAMRVEEMTVFEPSEGRETLEDLADFAHGLLGDRPSEDIVREIRDEW